MQDETNPTFVDADTAASQDAPATSPEGQEGGTQAPSVKTYTEEEVNRMVNIGRADLGRKVKEAQDRLTLAEQAAQRTRDLETQLEEIQRQRDEAELEAARKHPDTLDIVQKRIRLREENRKLEQEKLNLATQAQQFQADISEAREYKKLKAAIDISKKYPGVIAEELVSLTDGSPDKMEVLAKRLTAGRPNQPAPTSAKPDSGRGGGAREPTQEELERMPAEEYAAYWRKREGYG